MQGNEETPEIFQIMDNLNNVNPKIYKMDGFHYKVELKEEIKKLIERIKHHYDQSLPTEWRFIANEDKYIFTLHSYDDDSILLGIESDYKDLRLIIEYYTVFVDVHKERVLGYFNSMALSMPTYKNYDLLGSKDNFCSWYISKHIGTIATRCSFSFEEEKIPFEITIDYSFFDKINHTPQPLLRHVKEFFDELDNEFNFETKNSQLLNPATDRVEEIVSGKDAFEQRLELIKNANNTFLPNMPMSAVIEHFSVFYKKKNTKTNLPYLTQEQFINFIEKAFLGKDNIEKQSLTFSIGEKCFVISRFYNFYNLAVTSYRENGTNKAKYKSLIIDSFINWNKITEIESCFRANSSRNEW